MEREKGVSFQICNKHKFDEHKHFYIRDKHKFDKHFTSVICSVEFQ